MPGRKDRSMRSARVDLSSRCCQTTAMERPGAAQQPPLSREGARGLGSSSFLPQLLSAVALSSLTACSSLLAAAPSPRLLSSRCSSSLSSHALTPSGCFLSAQLSSRPAPAPLQPPLRRQPLSTYIRSGWLIAGCCGSLICFGVDRPLWVQWHLQARFSRRMYGAQLGDLRARRHDDREHCRE